jgi:hypothetical protein
VKEEISKKREDYRHQYKDLVLGEFNRMMDSSLSIVCYKY